MRLKSSGRVGVTNVHGPEKSGAENQRPDTRKKTAPLGPRRKTSASVLLTHCKFVPLTGSYFGAPLSSSNSAGFSLMKTAGTLPVVSGCRAARTSLQLPSSGRLLKLVGSLLARRHGPCNELALSQLLPTRR